MLSMVKHLRQFVKSLSLNRALFCGLATVFFGIFSYLVSTSPAVALPDKYQVIAKEPFRAFSFYEDQPWANPPAKLSSYDFLGKGRVVIIHLWATSCSTCVEELGALELFAKAHREDPIDVVTISLNDPRSGVLRNYFTRNHYQFIKPYHRADTTRPAIKGLPTTFFFNKNGELIGKIEGAASWSSAEMERLIDRLLAAPCDLNQPQTYFWGTLVDKIKGWFS